MVNAPTTMLDQAKGLWAKLTTRRKAALVGVVAVTAAGISALTLRTDAPKEAVLFSGLPADEAGAIIQELDAAKVAYRLEHGGGTILVPEAKVHALRLQMATSGLPKGGGYGFEDFAGSSPMGRTKFMEEKSYQRALSGELARSIGTIDAVERARVILAIPEDKLFSKSQEPPSASVVLTLRHGRALGPTQIKGIVHLVAAAVERLRAGNVSVVDETGNVLWSGDDATESDAAQRDLERTLTKRITDITERIVGPHRTVVSVTSELDRSFTERTEESYDKDRSAIRSRTRSEELVQGTSAGAIGVAGARGNLPGTATAADDGAGRGTERKKVTETQNNEISRVVAVTHGPKVQLKRLHVAVLVDGEPASEAVGAESKRTRTWSKTQLEQIAALAREAAGLDLARGDRIEVHCAPFHTEVAEAVQATPAPPAPAWRALVDQRALELAAVAFGVLALLLIAAMRGRRREVIEPIAMPALPLRAGEVDRALAGEAPSAAEPTVEALPDARTLALEAAKANPVRAARILSAWLAEKMPSATPPTPATAPVTEGESPMTTTLPAARLPGPQKASLVLLALDEDVAAEVLGHLDESEVKQLAERAEALEPSIVHALTPTFVEFHALMQGQAPLGARAASMYFRDLTVRALGADRAHRILSHASPSGEPPAKVAPIAALQGAKTGALAQLLHDEHPQVAAVIVAQLPRERAAEVLAAMDPEQQSDVLGRLAGLTEIPADAVALASAAMARALESVGALGDGAETKKFDGVQFTASLLNDLPPDDSQRLLGELNERFEKVAPKVRDAMFSFEDLSTLHNRSAQLLMREVTPEQLVIALKTASEDLRELFLGAISKRAAIAMREDLAILPPMRLSEVENAQRAIVEAAQRLARDGRIQLQGGKQEVMV